MSKHGTLPEYMYQRKCDRLDMPVDVSFDQDSEEDDELLTTTPDDDAEFDVSSDEDEEQSDEVTPSESLSFNREVGSSAHFLFCRVRSRFGRVKRFNNHLLL